ncbi:unnamed protein product [Caenorhabditis auriculariae]|uniref:beta-N-acetylhexosaminidase n=1 Tax=Caenorhabditis auriculariae TaxID=2777116 RepID=A0A8S1H5S3_9PELO|nr:unnamed protein product [Caenorhabditis auriculariae]
MIKLFIEFYSKPTVNCIRKWKPVSQNNRSQVHTDFAKKPGEMVSLHQQCQIAFGPNFGACPNNEYYHGRPICKRIWCKDRRLKRSEPCQTLTYFPAFDGTECARNMWCIAGECIENPKKWIDCKDLNAKTCSRYSNMKLVFLAALTVVVNGWYYGRPDPGSSTTGGVWPLPWTISYDSYNHTINPASFYFTSKVGACDVIDKATARYLKKFLFPRYKAASYSDQPATLTSLVITVAQGCDQGYPQLEMDESYQLSVTQGKAIATLTANQVWGALRGLESFSQLIYLPDDNKFRVRAASIADSPRFPHRGIMIDSSRHFLPVGVILQNIEIMAMNKMNVLHWHLVDSEAFPYTSTVYPQLSQKGAYSPRHVLRGVRVVPEFDTPGHTGSWSYSIPNLASKCYNSNGAISEMSNIIDATIPANYDFLSNFFTEALALFKDNYMHFGGDEVAYDMRECWYNNQDVRKRMSDMGLGSDTSALLNYYWKKLFGIIDKARAGTKKVVWQEVLDMNVPATDSIAHVWKGDTLDEVMQEMASVTMNHKAILSSCWYLNYIKYGADWGYVNEQNMRDRGMYYQCDPQNFTGTQAQKDRVLGGEAALWGEFVDSTNLIQRLWPRASAVAERLWSDPKQTTSADAAWPRLHEMRCRLLGRGFAGEPVNDPDFCPFEWDVQYSD